MEKSVKDLLTKYFEYRDIFENTGQMPFLSRTEVIGLECFAEWCDKELNTDD